MCEFSQTFDFAYLIRRFLDTECWLNLRLVNRDWRLFVECLCDDGFIIMRFGRLMGGKLENINLASFIRTARNNALFNSAFRAQYLSAEGDELEIAIKKFAVVYLAFPNLVPDDMLGLDYDQTMAFLTRRVHIPSIYLSLMSVSGLLELVAILPGYTKREICESLYGRGIEVWRYYESATIRCPRLPREEHAQFVRKVLNNTKFCKIEWGDLCESCFLAVLESYPARSPLTDEYLCIVRVRELGMPQSLIHALARVLTKVTIWDEDCMEVARALQEVNPRIALRPT